MINPYYNFDAHFNWLFRSKNEEAYSIPFLNLLTNKKSTMTKEQAINFGISIGMNLDDIQNNINMLNEKREIFKNKYMENLLKENKIFNILYKDKKDQMIIDAFPYEALFMMRY